MAVMDTFGDLGEHLTLTPHARPSRGPPPRLGRRGRANKTSRTHKTHNERSPHLKSSTSHSILPCPSAQKMVSWLCACSTSSARASLFVINVPSVVRHRIPSHASAHALLILPPSALYHTKPQRTRSSLDRPCHLRRPPRTCLPTETRFLLLGLRRNRSFRVRHGPPLLLLRCLGCLFTRRVCHTGLAPCG